jgi:hypothetical protein
MRRSLIAGFVVAQLVCPARAYEFPACRPVSPSVISITTLSKASPVLRRALARDVGWMAQPGEDFNATDVVERRLPSNRLIFIFHRAATWVVATEQGGLAYNDPLLAYRVNGAKAVLLKKELAYPNTVCVKANALIVERHN